MEPNLSQGNIPKGTIPEKGLWVTLPDGNPYCLYSPHPKQVLFHESESPNLLAIGSRGSGKSLMLRSDAHMRALSVPGCSLILIRKTMKQLEQSHLLDIGKEMAYLGGYYHGTKHCAFYPNGSRLFFSYVGHADDALNLLSAEFLAAYYDELSVIPWDYFQKLNASVRVSGTFRDMGLKGVVRAATNPLGPSMAEINQYFIDKEDIDYDDEDGEDENYFPDEWQSMRIDMEDNPTLDLEQYRKRFAKMAPHVKAAWLRGEYMAENPLFSFFPKDPATGKPYHVIYDLDLDALVKKARIYRVYDHGYAPDPAYCAWIAHLGNRYIVFHEKRWLRTIVSDIARSIKEEDEMLGIPRVSATYCDPVLDIHTGHDARTMRDLFEYNGVPMEPSINNREQFASAVQTALAEEAEPGIPRLQIYRGTGMFSGAPYLIKAIPLQRYDEKHPLRLANQAHDHPVVAIAYFLFSHDADESRTFEERAIPKWLRPKSNSNKRFVLGDESVNARR